MKIVASWDISLNVDCPHCNAYVDLMDIDDIGNLLGGILPCENRKNTDIVIQCPECDTFLTITETVY